jgi:hypothetical protein
VEFSSVCESSERWLASLLCSNFVQLATVMKALELAVQRKA